MVTHSSFCRACINACPTTVEVNDGRVENVTGDPNNTIFDGYTCVKGRAQPTLHNSPDRLLTSLKRQPDGSYAAVGSQQAIDEVAEKLRRIVDEHGPRAVACYSGTAAVTNCLTDPFVSSFMTALGSKMRFSANTIDKPGKSLALAFHGSWMAPLQGYHDPEVALVIGANPFKSYYGVACGHPGKWLGERMDQGMELLVVDPRRSDIAKRATIHLQPRPGSDPLILACLIKVILDEELFDHAFVGENANGLDELRHAVSAFEPAHVARLADVDADTLTDIARRFARAKRGYAVCGVGPGFSRSSTLVEYLVLLLETLCGHWLREGERVARTTTVIPSGPYIAQAANPKPAYGLGEVLRIRGLTETTAGMPTGALAEEILLGGEGQVKALICAGGNPVLAWPDQLSTVNALETLDLFVQLDPWMSASAQMADYVIAPPMFYEVPGMTMLTEFAISLPTWYGPAEAWAQFTEAVAVPPDDSDLVTEWEFFYGVAQKMGLTLEIRPKTITANAVGAGIALDMKVKPDAAWLIESLASNGRVPFAEVRRHIAGSTFPDPPQVVGPKEPGWSGRFDLASDDMMSDLLNEWSSALALKVADDSVIGAYPFRLISIRSQQMYNSTINDLSVNRGKAFNPAFLHPLDLDRLGLQPGDSVDVVSQRASIPAIVQADATLREGLVAMTHGFGNRPERDDEYRSIGSPTGRLLDATVAADPYVGMPRINDIPVRVCPRKELAQLP